MCGTALELDQRSLFGVEAACHRKQDCTQLRKVARRRKPTVARPSKVVTW